MLLAVLGAVTGYVTRTPAWVFIAALGVMSMLDKWLKTTLAHQQEAATAAEPTRTDMERMNVYLQLELAATKSEMMRLAADNAESAERIPRLQSELRDARAKIAQLEENLARPKGPKAQSAKEVLYGRLGLTPGVPDAYLPFLRRAIIFSLHPDRHPAARKKAAERRFNEAMEVFDEIKADRGYKAA